MHKLGNTQDKRIGKGSDSRPWIVEQRYVLETAGNLKANWVMVFVNRFSILLLDRKKGKNGRPVLATYSFRARDSWILQKSIK